MALSRFWSGIIIISLISILFAVISGRQYTLENILTGNTADDDPLKRRLVITEFTPAVLRQTDPETFAVFDAVKPNDKFQKSVKKTTLAVFTTSEADSVKGKIFFTNYIEPGNKGFPSQQNLQFVETANFMAAADSLRKTINTQTANYVYCSTDAKGIRVDSIYAYGNMISDSILLRRYNLLPRPAQPEDMLMRLLKDDNPLICRRDTVYDWKSNGSIQVSARNLYADGILSTCSYVVNKLWIPLLGILIFLCGLMNLLKESKADEKLARLLSPFFRKIFPELRHGHPAFNYMTLNFAANFLGLDNAATPFGLKAMESMQEDNPDKNKASNSQIMFLCLHAAGLTLIPTSIIGYRAVMNAANPADVMLPIIITSFIGTMAALLFVGIKQRINLFNKPVVLVVSAATALFALLFWYIGSLADIDKAHFTGNLGVGIFLFVITFVILFANWKEKLFTQNGSNIYASFIEGSKEGIATAFRILPYMIAMLVAISIFRNSGLMDIIMGGLTKLLSVFGVSKEITNALPVALLRPFSAGGARGFMFDAMQQFGADSLTGRLACLFEGAAETTFYVIAVYFGAVNVKDTRYTLSVMLLVDLVCVITATIVCIFWFR
ncbi:spore maturation protein [Sphingobacteriales bacterium UPWRP_1]|nr:hypothetical protein BVG80_06680 [Sphingobacteriales bacterium TSM_CSM]PSJ74498.1 spore maturation protein [Sphingobacteriales bacterium UPWRP_1]